MKLHHIGYLVKRMDKSIKAFEALGYQAVSLCGQGTVMFDEYRQCDISFLKLSSEEYIELIAPKTLESPIWGLMRTYKNTPYHLCYESEALEIDVTRLREGGWTVFQPPSPAPALGGASVVFLMHRSAGMIELLDRGNRS